MSPMNNDELHDSMQRNFKSIDEQFKESRIAYEQLRREFAATFVSRDVINLQILNIQQQITTLVAQLEQHSKVLNERLQHFEASFNEKIAQIDKSQDKKEQQKMSTKNIVLFTIGLCFSGISGIGGLIIAIIQLLTHH